MKYVIFFTEIGMAIAGCAILTVAMSLIGFSDDMLSVVYVFSFFVGVRVFLRDLERRN